MCHLEVDGLAQAEAHARRVAALILGSAGDELLQGSAVQHVFDTQHSAALTAPSTVNANASVF